MLRLRCWLLLAVVGLSPAVLGADQLDAGVIVRAVRFYRADQDRTRVKALVQIPLASLRPAADGHSTYTVSFRMTDSTGLVLYQQSWQSRAQHASNASDAYTVEIVDFVIAPGRYRIEAEVVDSLTGRKLNAGSDVRALSDTTGASDLLIAPSIREAGESDSVPLPGEFRTGDNLVTASARVLLTPLRAKVFYLMEAYSDREAEGKLYVTIRDSNGRTTMRTDPLPIKVTGGGSVLKGQLDLTGLPPGAYVMIADLELGGRVIQRSAHFSMAGLTETLARDSARRAVDLVGDEGYFAAMESEQLDSAKAPLLYVAESREMRAWSDRMSVDAKRRFLTNFWKKRDPTLGTPLNEFREQFYKNIAHANRAFREGGRASTPGWRSDRGRIYARYGETDDVYRRQQEGLAPPYEVWRYTKGQGYYYIFVDRTGFGAYQLVYSNDPKEPGLADWDRILGRRAVADVGNFLGVDLMTLVRQDLKPGQRF
jgi:GWxTD domain-containing protein